MPGDLDARDVCYGARPMKYRKNAKLSPDLDPATLAHLNVVKRNRERMAKALLKRRQRKSGQ